MWVRASSACYRTFTLGMARSPGFGSTACDYAPYSDSVSLRLPYTVKLATDSKSLTHYTKGTQSRPFYKASTACTSTVSRFYFTPLSGGSFFAFPSRVLVHYRSVREYLALEDGILPCSDSEFPRAPPLLTFITRALSLTVAITVCGRLFQTVQLKHAPSLGILARSLVATSAIWMNFFFLQVAETFQFPESRFPPL